jgi:hypothetical protein
MALKGHTMVETDHTEEVLAVDPRWQLVQRVVHSSSFERATQLRNILVFVTRSAISEPDRVLRVYDIACEVLDRRKDFDPASDNIVRSQFSHLRRKLETYFLEEGKAEPLLVRIPKGSYVPIFTAPLAGVTPIPMVEAVAAAPVAPTPQWESPSGRAPARGWWKRRELVVAIFCLAPSLVLLWILVQARSVSHETVSSSAGNAFVRFLARSQGEVTVVVPDLALVEIENEMDISDVPLSDYLSKDYPEKQTSTEADSGKSETLRAAARLRLTIFEEGMQALDLAQTMQPLGVIIKPRYARELRVSDLNAGKIMLLGGPGSDPWDQLFYGQLNFRFLEDRAHGKYYFQNVHPLPGEQAEYQVTYQRPQGDLTGYVNLALTRNPSNTAWVLLVLGSDVPESEAATKFFLHGDLPKEITSVLDQKDLHYFEFFLRGRHLPGQADDSFELVAIRSQK